MRKYLIGILIGASLMFSMQSFAAVGDHVDAIFANFNFIVNGHAKTLDATPIVVNGSSYLPVKDISNALGYDVTYKADSRTIELNQSVTGSVYATPSPKPMTTPAPTPHVSPVPSESVVTPPPSSDTIGLNTVDGGTTMSDNSEVFYSYQDLLLDALGTRIEAIEVNFKDNKFFLSYGGNDTPLIENVNYFRNSDGSSFYLSEDILLNYVTSDYLSKFSKYSINFTDGKATKIE